VLGGTGSSTRTQAGGEPDGTDAVTRVLIETSDGTTSWTTIGVAANILEASWQALVESVTYGLIRAGVDPR
jgi:2-isopropylmalate synthase